MAKRQSTENPDPFDGDFDDIDDLKLDDLRLEDLDIEDVDHDKIADADRFDGGSVMSAPLTVGQIIGGAVQVIFLTVLVLALFLAIGFGVVFAGQRLGVVPLRGAASAEVIALPTAVATPVSQVIEPTPVPQAGVPVVVATADCPSAAAWWNSQQIQDNYTYFTQTALTEARGSNRIPALMEQMRIRRSFVANFRADPCLNEAQAALLRGFDAMIEATRAIGANDEAATMQAIENINKAATELQTAMQRFSITLEVTPVA